MKKFTKRILVTALLAGSLATTAQAETASTTVQVFAGLAPVIQLTCTDVNFGTWRVPTGAGAVTTITLDGASDIAIAAGAITNVALSTTRNTSANGVCTVTGSLKTAGNGAATLTGGTASFSANTGSTGFMDESVTAPNTALETLGYVLALSSTTPAISAGGASFKIGGVMTIPVGLVSANYGDYKAPTVTVSFDDANGTL